MKFKKSNLSSILIVLILTISAGFIGLTGCSQPITNDPIEHPETISGTVPEATLPISATINVVTDPSLERIKIHMHKYQSKY